MAEEGIITYEKLYEVLRSEKYKKELQKLDQDFFSKVVKYLDEKKLILQSQESKDSVFASESIIKTKRQLENVRLILKELYEKREAKIMQMALFNSRTNERLKEVEDLIPEELAFYTELTSLLKRYREGIHGRLLNGRLPDIKSDVEVVDKNTKIVKILSQVPRFVGDDMNIYGPYNAEDVASLPLKVSEILIKNNRAKEISL